MMASNSTHTVREVFFIESNAGTVPRSRESCRDRSRARF
jgi:hypothetical protein